MTVTSNGVTNLSLWVALVFPAWVLLVSVYVLVTVRRSARQPL